MAKAISKCVFYGNLIRNENLITSLTTIGTASFTITHKMKLFCPNAKAKDRRYHNVYKPWDRFDPPTLLRDRAEALYEICQKYLYKMFRSQIKSDFAPCFSELYFCAIFKRRLGFNISHPSDKGPDFFIKELNC